MCLVQPSYCTYSLIQSTGIGAGMVQIGVLHKIFVRSINKYFKFCCIIFILVTMPLSTFTKWCRRHRLCYRNKVFTFPGSTRWVIFETPSGCDVGLIDARIITIITINGNDDDHDHGQDTIARYTGHLRCSILTQPMFCKREQHSHSTPPMFTL